MVATNSVNVIFVAQHSAKKGEPYYHKHEFYQMVCPLSGTVRVNEEWSIGPGQVMLTKPGQSHWFYAEEAQKHPSLFDCKFTVTDPELHTILMTAPHCFPLEAAGHVSNLVQKILAEAKSKALFYQKNIDYLFSSVLVCIARQLTETDSLTPSDPPEETGSLSYKGLSASQLTAYIDSNLTQITSLEDISRALYVNKSTLTDVCKHFFGLPPMRYVSHRRIETAKKLLLQSNLSISEISLQTGYSSIYYFSKAFKERVGVPPLSFREQPEDAYTYMPRDPDADYNFM